MDSTNAYDEMIDFIAGGSTPDDVLAFHPSPEAKARVWHLIEKEKSTGLLPDEKAELDQYMQLEHIMRLAKVRARKNMSRA